MTILYILLVRQFPLIVVVVPVVAVVVVVVDVAVVVVVVVVVFVPVPPIREFLLQNRTLSPALPIPPAVSPYPVVEREDGGIVSLRPSLHARPG